MGALHGYFANVAKAYPKQFGPVWKNVVATDRPEMDDLRRQLWNLRFQYWFRKIDSIGSSWSQAKVDARGVCCALKNPGQLTYKQIGTGFVWGVQIVGAFAFGEIYGRGAIGGYKVGDWWGSPVKAEEHH
jgi:hypothetical protein